MKILYIGSQYAGTQNQFTFEHLNLYLSLSQIENLEVDYFALDDLWERGTKETSKEILKKVQKTNPEILFLLMCHDLDKDLLREIKEKTDTTTVAILSDEDTDLYLRSLSWGGIFDLMWTFYPPAFSVYKKRGINVVGTNWAANTKFFDSGFRIQDSGLKNDISFVGSVKPEREKFINNLKKAGIAVDCYGNGWPNGPVSYEKMIEIFNQSKINLNLGFAKTIWRWQTLSRIFFSPSKKWGIVPDFWHIRRNFLTILNRLNPQSRARPFEISACGGFVLTNKAAYFNNPYQANQEMVFYDDVKDAVEKIKYYLANNQEREAIALAGSKRTIEEHSFKKRFIDVINFIKTINPKNKTRIAEIL